MSPPPLPALSLGDKSCQVLAAAPCREAAVRMTRDSRTTDGLSRRFPGAVTPSAALLRSPGTLGGGAAGAHVLRRDVTIPAPWTRRLATRLAMASSHCSPPRAPP